MGAPVAPYRHPSWTVRDQLAAYGNNSGNLLIGQSLREVLEISEFATEPNPKSADDRFDVIVVPAANMIFKEFDLSSYADRIEATNLPCVVAGLGAQAPHAGEKVTDIPAGSKRFLKVIAERSKVIGVRGNFTAEVMSDFGITNVRPIGCPSLYRSHDRGLRIRRSRSGAPLRVTLNGSRDTIAHMRSPVHAQRVEAALIRLSIGRGYSYVLQSEDIEIDVLASQTTTSQQQAALEQLLRDLDASDAIGAFANHIRANGRLFFDLQSWDDHMRSVDVSIGSRFHGNLIALTNGTPAVILNHDSRTTEMAELMGMPHVFTEDVRQIDPEDLLEMADFDLFEARYQRLYDRFADFLAENGLSHRLQDALPVEDRDQLLRPAGRIALTDLPGADI